MWRVTSKEQPCPLSLRQHGQGSPPFPRGEAPSFKLFTHTSQDTDFATQTRHAAPAPGQVCAAGAAGSRSCLPRSGWQLARLSMPRVDSAEPRPGSSAGSAGGDRLAASCFPRHAGSALGSLLSSLVTGCHQHHGESLVQRQTGRQHPAFPRHTLTFSPLGPSLPGLPLVPGSPLRPCKEWVCGWGP